MGGRYHLRRGNVTKGVDADAKKRALWPARRAISTRRRGMGAQARRPSAKMSNAIRLPPAQKKAEFVS